jgi:hypothetical protein
MDHTRNAKPLACIAIGGMQERYDHLAGVSPSPD